MGKIKEPTFRFFVHKDGQEVNIDNLTSEERDYVGSWAYKELVKGLGYLPVKENAKVI